MAAHVCTGMTSKEGAKRCITASSPHSLRPVARQFRAELPDNLKALFRPVTMVAPDLLQIAEIMLFSEGFDGARALARKMTTLYRVARDQLSKQVRVVSSRPTVGHTTKDPHAIATVTSMPPPPPSVHIHSPPPTRSATSPAAPLRLWPPRAQVRPRPCWWLEARGRFAAGGPRALPRLA